MTENNITADYIVGLTDGEGCFYVNIRPPDKRFQRSTFGVETHFYIKMRQEEKPLLEEVKNFLKSGAIYFQNEKRINHTPCYRFEINSQKDILGVLIPFFDKYHLRSYKKYDYELFRKIAILVSKKAHKNPETFQEILLLKSQMNTRARSVREIRSPSGNAK